MVSQGPGPPNFDADRLAELLDHVPAIIYMAEPGESGRWYYVSRGIEEVLGYSVEDWLDSPRLWARLLHPDDRERVLEVENAAATADPDPYAHEYRMVHRDGSTVWIRDESVLREMPDGSRLWHGVLSDITRQKDYEFALTRRAAAEAALARLGEHALERIAIPQLLAEAVEAAGALLSVRGAFVVHVTPEDRIAEVRASHGLPDVVVGRQRAGLVAGTQLQHTFTSGEATAVSDWGTEDRFRLTEPFTHVVTASVCARIEGPVEPYGVLAVIASEPYDFSAEDIGFVQSIANVLADALTRQDVEDAIEHRAMHDALTGLPNRVLFLDRLEQAFGRFQRHGQALSAVLFVDVDNFKHVNDTLGHHIGDELLVGVAQRLRDAVRPADTVARFGGDEFGLLLEEIGSERDAIATAERIASAFSRPFLLETGPQFVTASIGIVISDGTRSQASDLLRDADTAMYRAKERGRARYELFDEQMRRRALARMRLENDLRRAVDQHQLRLVYQPIVALRSEQIVAVEALLRWEHPERGTIGPSDFIPIAEDNGMMDRIGQWVCEQACHDAARWSELSDPAPVLVLNATAAELMNARFAATLIESIERAGLETSRVAVEVREASTIADEGAVRDSLTTLNDAGVGLGIDDFGTGRSSLSNLVRLPVRGIKLDLKLVDELHGDGLRTAGAAIAAAKTLDLRIVAEGAETVAQVLKLRELGCNAAQGALYSPPVAAAEIERMLSSGGALRRTL
jgi:diguanylate cyclase (GGDEF)-like protein/PAS domain S-box-containing protein